MNACDKRSLDPAPAYLPAPDGLRCALLRDPSQAIITRPRPLLAWQFPACGLQQTAYRILVATTLKQLNERNADLWDSGRVETSNATSVPYGGDELAPSRSYWWQVKVWSRTGLESPYSSPQQFHTGDFDHSARDFPAASRWIEWGSDNWLAEDRQRAAFHPLPPTLIHEVAPGHSFIAFEKSALGTLQFEATTTDSDTRLTIHLGERCDAEHRVHKKPGHTNIGYEKIELPLRTGTHRYTVRLAERPPSHYLHSQKMAPHHPEVLPFRFAEIIASQARIRIQNPIQLALFYPFDDTAAAFESSDAALDRVWQLCKYTLKATPFLGVYADGNRERMPYEADAYIQQLGHYSVDSEYAIARYTTGFLLDHASWPTEWQMHVVMMAWQDYLYTGDATLLRERYADLRRKTLIELAEANGLISTRRGKVTQPLLDALKYPGPIEEFRDIVDWPQGHAQKGNISQTFSQLPGGETDDYEFTDFNTVVNAFHFHALELMSRIAATVGKTDDAAAFAQRAATLKTNFQDTFFDPTRGCYRDGDTTEHASLHANMFPLAFGLVPPEHVSSVVAFIKTRGMACSVYGAHYLLEALFLAGEPDAALQLMTAAGKRGWLNMLAVGSSMTTEAWDETFKRNLTWNHAWGTAPANALARRLAGVTPLEPAFARFRIAPQPGSLRKLHCKTPTLRGPICITLDNDLDRWRLEITIPGNCESEIWIPTRFQHLELDGDTATPASEQRFAQQQWSVIPLTPGEHTLVAKSEPSNAEL